MRAGALIAALLMAASPALAAEDTLPESPLKAKGSYPEGPLIHDGALYYAEMTADRVMRWDRTGRKVFVRLPGCGPTSISPFGDERFAVTCHLGDAILITTAEGKPAQIITHSPAGERLTLPNDSHSDRDGGIYFSSSGPFSPASQPSGRVFHLKSDGTAHLVAQGINYANGVFVTGDGLLYLSEHMGKTIRRYRILEDKGLEELEPFADVAAVAPDIGTMPPKVGPDGLEVTAGGTVFVAVYGSGKVLQLSAVGSLQRTFDTGIEFVTSLVLDLDRNRMIVTGAHSNRDYPYWGEVKGLSLED